MKYTYGWKPEIQLIDGRYEIPYDIEVGEEEYYDMDPETHEPIGEKKFRKVWYCKKVYIDYLNYEPLVVAMIRSEYTLDAELAIQRQRNEKIEEFETYNAFCEACKLKAKEILGI